MALTQAQWLTKLKGWVPRWLFQEEVYNDAVFNGVAKALTDIQDEVDEHLEQTFLQTADDEFLDQHGDERTITRLTAENDTAYRARVRSLKNKSSLTDIRAFLDSVIAPGTSYEIREMPKDLLFAGETCFATRKWVTSTCKYNEFSIVIEPQTEEVYAAIAQAIEQMKALGVFYKIIEVPAP